MNSGHNFLFHKGFCTVYFGPEEKNPVTLPHSAERKHVFWGEQQEMSKTKKLQSRKKIAPELFHQRLGHRYTRSLLDGDTDNLWENTEIRIYPDPFVNHVKFLQ